MNKIAAVVGMCGSGKSTACDVLKELNWIYIRFGQITIDRLVKEGKNITPENEKAVRENLRKKYGMGAYATLSVPAIEKALTCGNVVIDGLYSWSEYKILKERFSGELVVLHIYSPPGLRYKRLADRHHRKEDKQHRMRKLNAEEAKKRDYAEIENIEKGGPIAMADYVVVNDNVIDYLKKQVRNLAETLTKPA